MQLRPLLAKFESLVSWLQSPLLLGIRLYWGINFLLSGRGKFLHLQRTTDYFESLQIPAPKINAIITASTECLGGALLALGLFARPTAVPLIIMLGVAYATSEQEALHALTSDPNKFVTADPFLFLFAAVIVLAFGPGKLSLDALFFRKSAAGK